MQIPGEFVENGCEQGQFHHVSDLPDRTDRADFAESAIPLSQFCPNGRKRKRGTESSGAEVQVLRSRAVAMSEVKPMQKTIHILFSDKRDIFQLVESLLVGVRKVDDVNPIRISRREPSGPFWCIDNRRWFCFTVFARQTGQQHVPFTPAKEVQWMSEFDDKLRQHPNLSDPMHVRTDENGLSWAATWLNEMAKPAGFSHCRAMVGIPPKRRVFVPQIPQGASRSELQEHFESIGSVSMIAILPVARSGQSRCAVVEFATQAARDRALETDIPFGAPTLRVRKDKKGWVYTQNRLRLGRHYPRTPVA